MDNPAICYRISLPSKLIFSKTHLGQEYDQTIFYHEATKTQRKQLDGIYRMNRIKNLLTAEGAEETKKNILSFFADFAPLR
ncbi:MAG: hypothetical protein A3K09_04310 [Nitrospinae bacterium RIFCSPLOWO2_12_FULL_47_7]|nr:MAG: hypothetical protein A3K09_04310 [Nitrospinae bacterium RIFCSPLOWO2_12_FULL_47_7]